jgi:transposase-like protein
MLEADFPKTMAEFQARFASEDACRDCLAKQKWPDGFKCPKCGGTRAWTLRCRTLWVCAACQHHCSLTAGTALEGTRKPLREWFLAMYLMTTSTGGVSAKELQRHLGCSCQTAWAWLHKLRAAMVDPNRKPLKEAIEVDESYIGGTEEGVVGRQTEKKAILNCAAEKDGRGTGRIRLGVIEKASREKINEFMAGKLEVGSVAHTDGWTGYAELERSGYRHLLTIVKASGMKAHELRPRVHRVFSLLKRWVLGTHQGSVSRKHLPAYPEEYTFRFNRRTAKKVTHGFQRLAEGIVRAKCRPYWQIVGRVNAQEPLPVALAA